MARRRPTDSDGPVAEDTLPLPASVDLSNGKRRTTAEKVGRFFRTRPVTSLLIIVALCGLAMITFSVGLTVGKAITSIFRSSKPDSSKLQDKIHPNSGIKNKSAVAQVAAKVDADEDDNADDNDEKKDELADDEKGVLVDGIQDMHQPPPQAERVPAAALPDQEASHEHTCYRKFEPGKLGWDKTLCVTDEFFFDISIGNEQVGTMTIGVFGDVVPKSAANFRALATCTGAFKDETKCYRGDSFHRVVTNFVAQGGSKATGRSIYGPTFKEEKEKDHHSFLQHGGKGIVSWAEYPIGSQFFVLIRDEATYLDGNHVVFGMVTKGLDVLDKIHDAPRSGEEPTSRITITNCGDAHKTD